MSAVTLIRSDAVRNMRRYYRLDVQPDVRLVVLHPRMGPHRERRADAQFPLPDSRRSRGSTCQAAGGKRTTGLWCLNGGITVAVRVFDIYAAIVPVTKDAARYLIGHDANTTLPFLAIDPTSGEIRNVPFMEEMAQVTGAKAPT